MIAPVAGAAAGFARTPPAGLPAVPPAASAAPATMSLLPGWEVQALRPFQRDVVDVGAAHFDTHARGQLVIDCGGGKSITALHLAHHKVMDAAVGGGPVEQAPIVMITAPNQELIGQWAAGVSAFHSRDPRGAPSITIVASDQLIGSKRRKAAAPTDPAGDGGGTGPETVRQTTTGAGVVDAVRAADERARTRAAGGEGVEGLPAPHYIISTNKSAPRVAAGLAALRRRVVFLTVDEAHRVCGADADADARTTVLPDQAPGAIKADARVFMTATPVDEPPTTPQSGRARTIPLTDADASAAGITADGAGRPSVRVLPLLEHATDPTRTRAFWNTSVGTWLPDGSALMVRALGKMPIAEGSPTDPHEVLHILPDQATPAQLRALLSARAAHATGHGAESPDAPVAGFGSSVLVPSLADAWKVVGLAAAAAKAGVGAPVAAPSATRSLGAMVEGYAARGTDALYMNDHAAFGDVIGYVTGDVISAGGYTSPYRVRLVAVRAEDVDRTAGLVAVDDLQERRMLAAAGLALARAAGPYDLRNTIAYSHSTRGADALARLLTDPALPPGRPGEGVALQADALHSGIPSRQRDARRDAFAALAAPGEAKVLSAVDMGREGVDVPGVDTTLIAQTIASVVDVTQIKGRAVRLTAGRPDKVATMLLPVIIDDRIDVRTQGIAAAIDPGSRVLVEGVIGALAATDEHATRHVRMDAYVASPDDPVTEGEAAIRRADVRERALRHLTGDVRQLVAERAPRRFTGVVFDRAAATDDAPHGQHRATLAVPRPGSTTDRPLILSDTTAPVAAGAALAYDRALDEHGLTFGPTARSRNFARPLARLSAVEGDGAGVLRGVQVVRGAGALAGLAGEPVPSHVATYEIRRLGGARTGAVAFRYADGEGEAARVADALLVRYAEAASVDAKRLNFPGEPPRHDLAARPVRDQAGHLLEGVEYDAAARRWWAYAVVPGTDRESALARAPRTAFGERAGDPPDVRAARGRLGADAFDALVRAGVADALAAQLPESVQSAATRAADGQVFRGAIHEVAYGMGVAAGALPPKPTPVPFDWIDQIGGQEGFVTSRGRFVSRDEADAIAEANEQGGGRDALHYRTGSDGYAAGAATQRAVDDPVQRAEGGRVVRAAETALAARVLDGDGRGPITVSLGFYARQEDAERARAHASVALERIAPDVQRTLDEALRASVDPTRAPAGGGTDGVGRGRDARYAVYLKAARVARAAVEQSGVVSAGLPSLPSAAETVTPESAAIDQMLGVGAAPSGRVRASVSTATISPAPTPTPEPGADGAPARRARRAATSV